MVSEVSSVVASQQTMPPVVEGEYKIVQVAEKAKKKMND